MRMVWDLSSCYFQPSRLKTTILQTFEKEEELDGSEECEKDENFDN